MTFPTTTHTVISVFIYCEEKMPETNSSPLEFSNRIYQITFQYNPGEDLGMVGGGPVFYLECCAVYHLHCLSCRRFYYYDSKDNMPENLFVRLS